MRRSMSATPLRALLALPVAVLLLASGPPVRSEPAAIVANDNRVPAGTLDHGLLTLHLVAEEGRWYPQAEPGPSTVVQAFAEEGGVPRIPGPLLRVRAGATIELSVRNTLAATLVLFGMHSRPGSPGGMLRIPPGATRTVRFRAGAPGTYFYWGSTTGNGIRDRDGRDSQLYGAFVVDSASTTETPHDRIFVMGVLHEPPAPAPHVMVINGKSWPYTERLSYTAGDTVHWRWLNPSSQPHPMHLHGFYFNVESRGSWAADTAYAPRDVRTAVTEMMMPGGTMTMTWIPSRAGHWLFHCHFGFHVSHLLTFTDGPPEKDPDSPATVDHTAAGMAGLVLGIAVRDRPGAVSVAAAAAPHATAREIRVFMQSTPPMSPPGVDVTLHRYAFVEQHGTLAPASDSVPERSSPLVLRRGEPVRITVLNRMPYPGAVHWHGIEVQDSYMDGVPGWSGSPDHLAPMIAPGDSFVASFTPPRAGTFIYHSHSNEYYQIAAGLAAPIIVLEPGVAYDTLTDRTFLINQGLDGAGRINGLARLDTLRLQAGVRYRFRLVEIAPDWRVFVTLSDAAGPVRWAPIAKDGADLPPHQRTMRSARMPMAPGETADFAYTPATSGNLELGVTTQVPGWSIRVPVHVELRARDAKPVRPHRRGG